MWTLVPEKADCRFIECYHIIYLMLIVSQVQLKYENINRHVLNYMVKGFFSGITSCCYIVSLFEFIGIK